MIAAAAMTLGCPDASCPAGSMAIGERCVAVDAGADAPGAPDACTLNERYEDHDDDGYDDLLIPDAGGSPRHDLLFRGGPDGLSPERCVELP